MLLIGNGPVITRNPSQPYLQEGCVTVRENKIVEVGTSKELRGKYPDASFLDAQGRVIMPGLINTHMHWYSSVARGMDLKAQSPHEFNEILERLWKKGVEGFVLGKQILFEKNEDYRTIIQKVRNI